MKNKKDFRESSMSLMVGNWRSRKQNMPSVSVLAEKQLLEDERFIYELG